MSLVPVGGLLSMPIQAIAENLMKLHRILKLSCEVSYCIRKWTEFVMDGDVCCMLHRCMLSQEDNTNYFDFDE